MDNSFESREFMKVGPMILSFEIKNDSQAR